VLWVGRFRFLVALCLASSSLSASSETFVYEVETTNYDLETQEPKAEPIRGTWTIAFDDSIFRVDAFLVAAASGASVPFTESLESGAHLTRIAGQELKVSPLEPLARMQVDADALLLVGRFPRGGAATALEVRRESLFPGAVEQITLRKVDGAVVPAKAVLLYGEREAASWTYTASGPRDSSGPLSGYQATIERRWSDGRLAMIEKFTLKSRSNAPPTSLTDGLTTGAIVIDLRLGLNDQRSYTWKGKLPSLAELKAMGSSPVVVPTSNIGQTLALWTTVSLAALTGILAASIVRRRNRPPTSKI
jgi:hypothetical protein